MKRQETLLAPWCPTAPRPLHGSRTRLGAPYLLALKAALVAWLVAFALVLGSACGAESSDDGEIRDQVAPSMVKIHDQFGRVGGSGFIVKGGYVVTAAHVAWPGTSLDVLFDDGTEYGDVPVLSYDHFADLAFLGPIDTSAPRLELAGSEELHEGDAVFLFGYPGGEVLSVNPGAVYEWPEAGYERWEEADVSILYSTAISIGGMSGGPIVNGNREVIGVLSGFAVTRSGDHITTGPALDTVRRRLHRVEIGREASLLGSRVPSLDTVDGVREHEVVLDGVWDIETFVFHEPSETPITIQFEGESDVEYAVVYWEGSSLFDDIYGTTFRPARKGIAPLYGSDEPGFLVVKQRFDREQAFRVKSSAPLTPLSDPDDGREMKIGVPVSGILDTSVDIDRYTIRMYRGQRIGIRYGSLFPGVVSIDHSGAPLGGVVSQEYGEESVEMALVYEAPFDGEFSVVVSHPYLPRYWTIIPPVGYTLVAQIDSGHSQPAAGSVKPPDVIGSVFGDTLRHTFERPFPSIHIDYPLYITGNDEAMLGATLFEQGRRGETLALEESDLTFYDELLTVDRYVRRSVLANGLPIRGEKVTARREVETSFGSPVLIEEFVADDGKTKGVRLAYVHKGTTGVMAIFYAASDVFDDWRPVVEYCIGTFSIGGDLVGR